MRLQRAVCWGSNRLDFPPDKVFKGSARKMIEEAGGGHALDKGKARHDLFHKTNTVDYGIVLEGEIWAMLDEGETLRRPGDVLIQRGTNHSWSTARIGAAESLLSSSTPSRFDSIPGLAKVRDAA